jgi:hypothetical protein
MGILPSTNLDCTRPSELRGGGSPPKLSHRMKWPWARREKRSLPAGFTNQMIAGRAAWMAGQSSLGELCGAVQCAISLWEFSLANANVTGTKLFDWRTLALIARSLALTGECVLWVSDLGLIPASTWVLATEYGRPVAYRITISEIGGMITQNALAGEILHLRIGCDIQTPWSGSSPLRRSSLSAGLLNAVELALAEVYQSSPIGSQIVPYPESGPVDLEKLSTSFVGRRGRVMLRESVNVVSAGGAAPQTDWRPVDLTPDLSRSMSNETLRQARDALLAVYGLIPAMFEPRTTGPLIREGQRHLCQFCLQPIATGIAQEASEKLGVPVEIDVIKAMRAFDEGGRSRALAAIVSALAEAKTAGLDPAAVAQAMRIVDLEE